MRFQKLFTHFLSAILLLASAAYAQDSFNKKFSGSINNRYAIQMTLQRRGESLSGSYVYTKVGKPITLRGRIDGGQNVFLEEFDESGNQTGEFKGRLTSDSFAGTWSKPDGSRAMPFLVRADVAIATTAEGKGSVLIDERKETLKRGVRGRDYKEAIISYPVVKGLDNALLSKTQSALSLKAVFDSSLEELRAEFRESEWLHEISYEVNYNKNSILDITFSMSGAGAYPTTTTKTVVVNLKNGELLKAIDMFDPSSLNAIAAMVDKAMQAEIRETLKENGEHRDTLKDMFESARFERKDLDSFSISDRGMTFLYDFDFPHVAKALEPAGAYFFSFDQLRPYIKRDGPLGVFIR